MSDASRPLSDIPRAFVCGWPIAHSRSPLIHGGWLAQLGLSGSYERIAVRPEEADAFFATLREKGFVGGNVTIPHKEAAFRAAARLDAAAEAIGAVNTLWFENDRLVGGNTDAYGFATNLDERLPGWRDAGSATVLGAGGAARAVVHALLAAGVSRVMVLNRTIERADELANAFGAEVSAHGPSDWNACLAAGDLLVNTLPDDAFALPIDLSMMAGEALVADIVYVPLETPLLAAAKARGLKCADGLGMLLHQAVPGFERWFGHRPAVTPALRERVLADIARR